jgi:hypothetical protein
MQYRKNEGNLSLANSRPGCIVRCVTAPSKEFFDLWGQLMGLQAFLFIPEPHQTYLVRANVLGDPNFPVREFASGVLLSQRTPMGYVRRLRNPEIPRKYKKDILHIEPFFPHNLFQFVASRP